MQEKTLEELLDEYASLYETHQIHDTRSRMQEIISFISSREDKAREEGHIKGYKERCEEEKDFIKDNYEKWKEEGGKEAKEGLWYVQKIGKEAITQYKEELLGKFPDDKIQKNLHPELDEAGMNCECGRCMIDAGKNIGFNECLSEVKKLL